MEIHSSGGRAPSRTAIAVSIALLVVVWAVNFIAAKIGLLYLPPLAMASFRVVFAGAILGILWLDEKGSWIQVLGGVLALSGVY